MCGANVEVVALLLASKYRNALKIRATQPALRETMASMGVEDRSVFETWLEKEKEYLRSLSKEPEQETLQMEYYQKLVNLRDHECVNFFVTWSLYEKLGRERLNDIRKVALPIFLVETGASYAAAAAQTRRIETQRRHTGEVHSKTLAAVQDLELRLGITERWRPEDEEWAAAVEMLRKRRYQRALDDLEALVVARIFELSKVNLCDTGYRLRKHIAKALQACSKAMKTSLDRYNAAAAAMSPPRRGLSWEQIVDYVFLSDFDLLREGREDIRTLQAAPCRRRNCRLNLEIPRFITHMADQEAFLLYHERRLCDEGDEALAHQVALHRMERGHFDAQHMDRLVKLSKEPGFTASLTPGISVNREQRVPDQDVWMDDTELRESAGPGTDAEMSDGPGVMHTSAALGDARGIAMPPVDPDMEEEEDRPDFDVDALADVYEHIMRLTHDAPRGEST
ncbi:hypothetical protein K438DRAFT_1775438 [Mycena galopus ATCC 62051]|nr:hypothetical protein K438DRAFT_1775438 [Mycena galopus ATCC 62051]